MKLQKEGDLDRLCIQKARENTRLDLRKQKVTLYIQDKKLASISSESIHNSKLTLNPDLLELSNIELQQWDCKNFNEHLSYLIDSFSSKLEYKLRHAIYITRRLLCSERGPKTTNEIEQSKNQIFELIKVFDYYSEKDTQMGFELIWIFSIILYYLNNDSFTSILFSEQYVQSVLKFVKANSESDEAIIYSLIAIGNGITNSMNRSTLILSSFFDYLIELTGSFRSIEVLTCCIWIFTLIAGIKPDLSLDVIYYLIKQ